MWRSKRRYLCQIVAAGAKLKQKGSTQLDEATTPHPQRQCEDAARSNIGAGVWAFLSKLWSTIPKGKPRLLGALFHPIRGQRVKYIPHQRSSYWGPHSVRQEKNHHFVGIWSVLCHLHRWWSICREVCGAHGDSDIAEKLGRPDVVRLAQLLRSSRLCRIFGTQIMGPRGSGWNGRDPLWPWF